MNQTPQTPKQGDRVRVTIEGEVASLSCDYVYLGEADGTRSAICRGKATIEILPPEAKPLEVGEQVMDIHGKYPTDLLNVSAVLKDGWHVVEDTTAPSNSNKRYYAVSQRQLKRPNGIPIQPYTGT